MVVAMFLTPLLCVVALTVVLLNPLPWQEEQERLRWSEWEPVPGGLPWQLVQDCVGGGVGVGDGVPDGLLMNAVTLVMSEELRLIP
jgi:hypothetical protein